MATTGDMYVATGADDAVDDGTTCDGSGSYLTAGFSASKTWTTAFRFVPGTAIPAGATITAINFGAYQAGRTGSPALRIYFEHEAAPLDFSGTPVFPSARARTTAFEDWAPDTGTEYKYVTTADLIAALQEVVNAHAPLSAIVVIITDNYLSGENYSQFNSKDLNSNVALLNVTYTEASTGGWLKYRHI